MSPQYLHLPTLNAYVQHWSRTRPNHPAMIQHEDGRIVSYRQFDRLIDFFALRLLDMGIVAGDRLASQLVLVPEHLALMYAAFKIGAIFAPLDVRLKDEEVVRDLNKIRPKAFFFLGHTPVRDFRSAGAAVREGCPSVVHLVQFTPNPGPGDILQGASAITEMMARGRLVRLKLADLFKRGLQRAYSTVARRTPALIIFTTGTTGEPKPAVLTHENVIVQNEVLARGIEETPGSAQRLLINLPPSHVGCVTEAFMTGMFIGGTAVMLRIFDVKATLEAIEKHRVSAIGQIPTQYRMLWKHPDYAKYDLSSLQFAIYAGSAVDQAFLERLAAMAPRFGTGLGMTENAGFATFTFPGISIAEMAGQVGRPFDDLAPVTVRAPMNDDGTAGPILTDGEIGEICYHPPIVFAGYYDQPEETARVVSKEGILYTGDLGYFQDKGAYRALYLSGRRKFVIKQKGYNVFPDEVEHHIALMPEVDTAEVVGVAHRLFDEGIMAFVKPRADTTLTPEAVLEHCHRIAAYKRPLHVEIWPVDEDFPLTRTTKVDKMVLKDRAEAIVTRLRAAGKWDAQD